MKESKQSIYELGKELERAHKLLHSDIKDVPAGLDKGTLEHNIHEMQDLLIRLTKRWNGMEY